MPDIVQFIHPGAEHGPDTDNPTYKSWNIGSHKRKFMATEGTYIQGNNPISGTVAFWGEWEPPSSVARFPLQPDAKHPRWLHTPRWDTTVIPPNARDTDPYVFGETFRYSICLQARVTGTTFLAELEPGSIVLFGSHRLGEFVLDTVFVVDSYDSYQSNDPDSIRNTLSYDEYYATAFAERIIHGYDVATDQGDTLTEKLHDCTRKVNHNNPRGKNTLRSYQGASYKKPFLGMYSFVPAKPWNDGQEQGFPRLALHNANYITNKLKQGQRRSKVDMEECQRFWEYLVQYCRQAGYVEGVAFNQPR